MTGRMTPRVRRRERPMRDWGKAEWFWSVVLVLLLAFIVIVMIGQSEIRAQCEAIGGVPIDAGYRGTSVICLTPEAIRK